MHACWNDDYIDALTPYLGDGGTLTDELIVWSNRKGHWAFEAVEALCKGLEVSLPQGMSFTDKDGKTRTKARIRWWEQEPRTFRKVALAPTQVLKQAPDVRMPADRRIKAHSGPPVFFGHYCLTARPAPLAPRVACVDYSAGDGGSLVAYRWDGETELRATHFIWV